MELASIIINAGIFIATVIAAIIAWKGVENARKASEDAGEHERAALRASESAAASASRSADEHKRAADALTRQVDLLEAASAPAPEPWEVERHNGPLWAVTNRTGMTLTWAELSTSMLNDARVRFREDIVDNVPPDGRLFFEVVDGSVKSLALIVTWLNPGAQEASRWVREVSLY